LKKVSKYDNKFKKLGAAAAEAGAAPGEGGAPAGAKSDFRAQLKVVKKDIQQEILEKTKKSDKPDWHKKGPGEPAGPPKEEAKPKEEKPKEEAPPAPAPEPEPAAEEPAAEEEEEGGEEEEEEGDEEEEE